MVSEALGSGLIKIIALLSAYFAVNVLDVVGWLEAYMLYKVGESIPP